MLFLLLACVTPPDDAKPAPTQDGPCELATPWYLDGDGDGHGGFLAGLSCEPLEGAVTLEGDCDDTDPTVHPGAPELCDGADQDCDDVDDDGLVFYSAWPDEDGDGYGDTHRPLTVCDATGTVPNDDDCDDTDPAVSPDATEVCNGDDDDCDGLVDDADPDVDLSTWVLDADGDGYGDDATAVDACVAPAEHVAVGGDCDPADATVHPGAEEVCLDGVDQDCDGIVDDYTGVCWPTPEGDIDTERCDPVEPMDVALCGPGVAAVRPTGATYSTVQLALNAAVPGDVVTVCPGTWSQILSLPTSPLTLVGFGADQSVLTSPDRILDMGTGQALTLVDLSLYGGVVAAAPAHGGAVYGEDAELCALRTAFVSNSGSNGGAVFLYGESALTLDECLFFENATTESGGAVYLFGDGGTTSTLVEDTVFQANESGSDGGALQVSATPTVALDNVTFRANTAFIGDGGGMAYAGTGTQDPSTCTLDDVLFEENTAGVDGGALALRGTNATSPVTITSSDFVRNWAGYSGGALTIFSGGETPVSVANATFTANSAVHGGAIDVSGRSGTTTTLTIESAVLDANVASGVGGAIMVETWGTADVTLTSCAVTANTAATLSGGARLEDEVTLTSVDTDWGTGATDNAPDDVHGQTWAGVASFSCEGTVCR